MSKRILIVASVAVIVGASINWAVAQRHLRYEMCIAAVSKTDRDDPDAPKRTCGTEPLRPIRFNL